LGGGHFQVGNSSDNSASYRIVISEPSRVQ
jgi:hypothetical protein